MIYTGYILRDKNNKLYKGVTNNLNRRLKEHKSGHTVTTSKMEELIVVYTEEFITFESAIKREKYFKTAAGRRFIKKLPL